MDENELLELFSAFDDVSAPESLKSSTLDFIMSAAAAPVAEATAAEAAQPAEPQAPASTAPVTATRGGAKARIRNKWRAMRVAAVAACLALVLTGGVAYAFPASTVLLTQGDTTVELKVNLFGQVVSAFSNDEATQDLINQMGLVHMSSDDSIARVKDSLEESNPAMKVQVIKNGSAQNDNEDGPQPPQQADSHGTPAVGENAALPTPAPASLEDGGAPEAYTPAPEIVVVIPDPSGSTSGDDSSGTSDQDTPSTPEPTKPVITDPDPDPVDPGDSGDSGDPEPEPTVDPDPEPEPDPEPDPEPEPEPEPDPEPTYDNTKPPQLHGMEVVED